MGTMKNAICTASDAKYGDFVIEHWLASLKANVDLSNTDILVFDYGFSTQQRGKLLDQNVKVIPCVRNGHVVSLRFRDMAIFLQENAYDQVLATDGGDIIFQTGLTELFEKNKTAFRAVTEDFNLPFERLFIANNFSATDGEKIKRLLEKKPMINAGVLVAPHNKFLALCQEIDGLVLDKSKFGPDQVAVNYILYRDGFVSLSNKFNFVFTTMTQPFRIQNGVFLLQSGEKIPIVHNAGGSNSFRPIKNFGFGPSFNRLKRLTYWSARIFTQVIHSFQR